MDRILKSCLALLLSLGGLHAAEEGGVPIERGFQIKLPIEGAFLSGDGELPNLEGDVVFLTRDGRVFSADSAEISNDQKSILFQGRPLISSGSTRNYSEGRDEWFRVHADGRITKSEGYWILRKIEVIRR